MDRPRTGLEIDKCDKMIPVYIMSDNKSELAQTSAPAKTKTTWRYGVCGPDMTKMCVLKGDMEFIHEGDENEAKEVLDQFIYELRKQVKFIYHPELKQEYEATLQAAMVQEKDP